MSTPRDLLNAAKAEITEIDPNEVAARLDHYTLLDVREPDEYEQGAVPGAVHVARGNLEFSVEGRLPDKNAPIAVYCAGGMRSAFATKTLQDLGYTDVVSITGGFNKWKDEGLDLDDASRRYGGTAQPLPATPPAARGRRGGPDASSSTPRSSARRRRARVAGGALPRRCGRGHDRHHRHGRRGRLEPPASDPAQRRPLECARSTARRRRLPR